MSRPTSTSAAVGVAAIAGSISVWTLGTDFTSTYSEGTQLTDRGTWTPNTYYNPNELVQGSDGNTYVSKAAIPSSNDLDPTTDTNNTEWRNVAWKSSTSYNQNDVVQGSDGKYYFAINPINSSNDPDPTTDTNHAAWRPQSSADSMSSGSVAGFSDTQAGGGVSKGGYQSILSGYKTQGSNPNTNNNRMVSQLNTSTGTIQSNAPNNPVSGAISKTSVPAGTSAFIDQGATVTSGGSVWILGKEKLGYTALIGSLAGGGVGLGASIGIATVKSNTDAHVGAGATVTAGSGSNDVVVVNAALNGNSTGKAFGGQVACSRPWCPGDRHQRQQHPERACRFRRTSIRPAAGRPSRPTRSGV